MDLKFNAPSPPIGPSREPSGHMGGSRRPHGVVDGCERTVETSFGAKSVETSGSLNVSHSWRQPSDRVSSPLVMQFLNCLTRPFMRQVTVDTQNEYGLFLNNHKVIETLRDQPCGITFKAVTRDYDLRALKFVCLPPSQYPTKYAVARRMDSLVKLKDLYHPNLAKVYACTATQCDDGAVALALTRDYIREGSRICLQNCNGVFTCEPLSVGDAFHLFVAVISALVYLHEHHIYHGHLAPANVLSDGYGHVLVVDYGLPLFDALTDTSSAAAPPGTDAYYLYQSPQALTGEMHDLAANDMWAAGAILYTALAGRPPFPTARAAALAQSAPPLPSHVADDGWLSVVLAHILTVDEGERWTARNAQDVLLKVAADASPEQAFRSFMGLSPAKPKIVEQLASFSASHADSLVDTKALFGVPCCGAEPISATPVNVTRTCTTPLSQPPGQTHKPRTRSTSCFDALLLTDPDTPHSVLESVGHAAHLSLSPHKKVPSSFNSLPAAQSITQLLDTTPTSGSTEDTPTAFSSIYAESPKMPGCPRIGVGRGYLIDATGSPAVPPFTILSLGPQVYLPHPPRSSSTHTNTSSPHSCTYVSDLGEAKAPPLPLVAPDAAVTRRSPRKAQVVVRPHQSTQSTWHSVPPLSFNSLKTSSADAESGQSLLAFAETVGNSSVDRSQRTVQRGLAAPRSSLLRVEGMPNCGLPVMLPPSQSWDKMDAVSESANLPPEVLIQRRHAEEPKRRFQPQP